MPRRMRQISSDLRSYTGRGPAWARASPGKNLGGCHCVVWSRQGVLARCAGFRDCWEDLFKWNTRVSGKSSAEISRLKAPRHKFGCCGHASLCDFVRIQTGSRHRKCGSDRIQCNHPSQFSSSGRLNSLRLKWPAQLNAGQLISIQYHYPAPFSSAIHLCFKNVAYTIYIVGW